MTSKPLSTALLLSSTILASASLVPVAYAQTSDAPVTVSSDTAEEGDKTLDRVVITGSRIAQDSALTAPSPVLTLDNELFRNSGDIDVGVSLRNIPALQGSDPASLAAAQGAATGLSTLDLRQLGANRTLVLQDGRRHVPGVGGSQAVDIGAIPQVLIDRVEVLTGGASSVYGADAVSGVVNFVLRDGRDFDGLEYRLQTGISDKGDAEDVFASLAYGGTFDSGRGSAVFAAEYSYSSSILAGDRDFAGSGFSSLNATGGFFNSFLGIDPAAENAFIPNPTLPVSSGLGLVTVSPFGGASPFFELSLFLNEFVPGQDTIPNSPGTNVPVVQVVDNGVLRPFDPGIALNSFNAIGGDSIPAGNADSEFLIPEQQRFVFAGGFDYELLPNMTVFADAKFVFNDALDQGTIPFSDDIPLALDNAFLPQAILNQVADLQAAGFSPSIGVARDILDPEVDGGSPTTRQTIRATGGIRGEIPTTGFNYEVSYGWGRTDIEATTANARLNDRYFTAIDAVALTAADFDMNGNLITAGSPTLNAIRNGQDLVIDSSNAAIGDIVCRSELTGLPAPSNIPFGVGGPPLFGPGTTINGTDVSSFTRPVTFQIGDGQCAPVNILGGDSIRGAGADFAFVDLLSTTEITQQQLLATVSGDTGNYFELPAGPIGIAAGLEWRKDESQFIPDNFLSIEPNVVNNTSARIDASPTDGQNITVFELFGEVQVPLLKDLPFAEYLEVTASGRYSDYNTIGSTGTFSVGGRYQPHEWVTLRGTYSRAIRAPNIGELFDPQGPATIAVGADPCDDDNILNGSANREANCLMFVNPGFDAQVELTAFVTGTTGGNPNLTEETAETFTVGGVFQPGGFLDGLVLIADYYDIEITDAIGSLSGAAIAAACVDLPSIDNQFCDNIQRVPRSEGGEISGFTSGNINLAILRARGLDFEARYAFDMPNYGDRDLGTMNISLAGTRFLERFTEGDPVIQEVIASEMDPVQQQLLIVDQAVNNDLLNVIGVPEWVFNLGLNWEYGKWNIGWTGRFESSTQNFSNGAFFDVEEQNGQIVVIENPNLADPSQLFTGSGFEQDVSVNYEFSDWLQIYGGVSNLTDREPFLGSLARPVGPRGRFFFLGVRGVF